MHADRPSTTASYVAMGRALAHARRAVRGFDDPFALQLLPDDYRAAVERRLRRGWPRSRREAALALVGLATERLMGPRTAEIDDGLRGLPPGYQLVVLGAGLDARAYRMPELSASVAFEIDHPASQAFKRRVTEGLRPVARELRHVAVDFEREGLGEALERAGHSTTVPTAWIFEGVITYLTPADVAASLDVIAERSAPRSRLLATYNESNFIRRVVSKATMPAGEPMKAVYSPAEMRGLLESRGFAVVSDRDGSERALRWGGKVTALDRAWVKFHHVVIADRPGSGARTAG